MEFAKQNASCILNNITLYAVIFSRRFVAACVRARMCVSGCARVCFVLLLVVGLVCFCIVSLYHLIVHV